MMNQDLLGELLNASDSDSHKQCILVGHVVGGTKNQTNKKELTLSVIGDRHRSVSLLAPVATFVAACPLDPVPLSGSLMVMPQADVHRFVLPGNRQ